MSCRNSLKIFADKERLALKRFSLPLLALSAGTITAYASTQSTTLNYNGSSATAKLDVDFGWVLLGHSDDADATTTFTTSSNSGRRVAVRLERWDTASAMSDYKYQSDSWAAECTYSWSNVDNYQSRHSIDNSTNTVEYVVRAFTDEE